MKRIPGTEMWEFDPELVKIRAGWLASKYGLPYDRVYKVLDQTVLKEPIYPFEYEPDEVGISELVHYLIFEPSMEEALTYLRPEVALTLFESEKPESIAIWMKQSSELIGKHTVPTSYLLDVSFAPRLTGSACVRNF